MKKQTPKAKRLTEVKRKHLKTVKRRQLSEVKKSIGKYLNEALNKDLKDFGTDLKKFLEEKGLTVKLGQGSAQPLYEPISKNDKYAALQLSDDSLHVIVSDSKIDVLEDLIKKYSLSTLTDMKKSGGWDEDPNKKTQSEGEIYLAQELKQGRKGKAFELVIRRFNPSDIMEKTNLKFHPLNEVKNSLKKSIRNYQRLNENEGKGNYSRAYEVFKSYEDDKTLQDFLRTFPKGEDINEADYFKFVDRNMDDSSDEHYAQLNWKYIVSGDKSVFNDA